jgi:phosphoribosylformimino-5-aminoimidazole carboxamide ribotide isomerase
MRFDLIPAIDLLDGSCVRLAQGRYDAATVYERDAAAMAARFVEHPIAMLHVVDLDGAKAGKPVNDDVVRRIVESAGDVPVQLGGGIRTQRDVEAMLATGVDRVVMGTVALREPTLVREVAARFAGRIVVGVAVEGWLEESEASVIDVAKRFEDAGVAAIVYTDIARDGMLSGPNLEATAALADAVDIPVILSGGVSSLGDLLAAAAFADRGIVGAIVGRALYTGDVEIASALERIGSV